MSLLEITLKLSSRLALFCLLLLSAPALYAAECVVLLHGLLRGSGSMEELGGKLSNAGYAVANVDYASRSAAVPELAERAVGEGLARCRDEQADSIHFVTHSMGGILLRQYLEEHEIADFGRAVMLGPPNQGSEAADRLEGIPGFRLLTGPAGPQLGTAADDLPAQLKPVDFELGVIAGTRAFNPLLSLLVPDPDDGTVSVASTRVEGMCAFVTMPATHFWMMYNDEVIAQTLEFLATGAFSYSGAENGLCE